MGTAIGQSLPMAIGVAISPMPIVAVILMLVTPQARTNGPAFLIGWIIGVAGLGGVLLLVADPAEVSDGGAPADWVPWLELALGLLLLLVALRQWRSRPDEGEAVATPKWMGALEDFTPIKAAGTAVLLSAVNPKNLLLIVSGAAAIAQTGSSSGDQAVALVVFTIIAAAGVAAPVVIFFALGSRAAAMLDSLKTWMIVHNAAIMAVLCLVIGVKLIGDAISGFSA